MNLIVVLLYFIFGIYLYLIFGSITVLFEMYNFIFCVRPLTHCFDLGKG